MKQILIVDDDLDLQFLLKNLLSKNGFNILKATNGFDALDLVRENKPALVLLDIRLPGINGMEVLKKIRQMHSSLPVIMITSITNINQAIQAKKMGAVSYITKPFDYKKLLAILKKTLGEFAGEKNEKRNIFHRLFFFSHIFKRSNKLCLPV